MLGIRFQINAEGRPFRISLLLFLVKLLITSLPFPSWHLHEKLNNAPCANNYSVHTMNSDVYITCEVPATVNIHRAKWSLSHDASNIFPNNSPCSLRNDCITNLEQITRDVRMSNEERSSKFKQKLSCLIWKNVYARDWKFGTKWS